MLLGLLMNPTSQLTMEMVHEAIQKIARRHDELFQMLGRRGTSTTPGKDEKARNPPLKKTSSLSATRVISLGTPADTVL